MNERIEELKEKATEIHYSGPGDLFILDPEKFAKLIVRECIAQIRKDENGVAYEAAARIIDHFGIDDEQTN